MDNNNDVFQQWNIWTSLMLKFNIWECIDFCNISGLCFNRINFVTVEHSKWNSVWSHFGESCGFKGSLTLRVSDGICKNLYNMLERRLHRHSMHENTFAPAMQYNLHCFCNQGMFQSLFNFCIKGWTCRIEVLGITPPIVMNNLTI